MRTVLIVCGAGASSTFLALAMRGRAAERQLELRIEPVAESQLADRLPQADALLIGVHLAPRFSELQSAAAAVGVPAVLLGDGDVGGAGADRAVAAALTALDGSPEVASAPASASLAPHQIQ
jgi:PTS system cellobiose-specific IIB component